MLLVVSLMVAFALGLYGCYRLDQQCYRVRLSTREIRQMTQEIHDLNQVLNQTLNKVNRK
jgi:hypothetical protein